MSAEHAQGMDRTRSRRSRRTIKFEAYPAMQLGGTPVQLYDQVRTVS